MNIEEAKLALNNDNYVLAARLYEKCLTDMDASSTELYLSYADALAKCGRTLDSLDVYSLCSNVALVSSDRIRHLVTTFLDMVTTAGLSHGAGVVSCGFGCAICDNVLCQPTTLPCGHTFCTQCVVRDHQQQCRACGHKLPSNSRLETNVIAKNVTEKWFHSELVALRLREEGNKLCQNNQLEDALLKYNASIDTAPNHMCYANRSHVLYRMNRLQAALEDAEAAISLRPHWAKGYYRRAVVMSAMGQHEEAFVSFALCAALDNSTQAMKTEITRLLRRLLVPSTHGRQLCVKSRRNTPYYSATHFLPTLNTSDCEEISSGDDEYQPHKKPALQVPSQPNKRLHKIFARIFQEIERLKRLERKPAALRVDQDRIDPSDFDCVLCCRMLWKPVTTPCGHTYCSMCLDRCLDYSSACPLCMTSLSNYLGTSNRHVTQFLEEVMVLGLPDQYRSRLLLHREELSDLERAPDVPVFVCTTAFPSVPCPLFIYEPRYRLMVRRCVESGCRQFAIAACLEQGKNRKRYADYGTMLKIEDWVLLGNGCSILTTVGMRRFRVLSRGETDGYDTAQISFLSDTPIEERNLKEIHDLHDRVLQKGKCWFNKMLPAVQEEIWRTCGHMPEPEPNWTTLSDGPSWLWWLLAILPLGKPLQVGILSITSLAKRLQAIEKTLDHLTRYANSASPLQELSKKKNSIPSQPS